jgi:serine/threonine protein kinase
MEEQYIGNYRVLKKIGAGGSARVYLGVHKDVPNLKVILKILSDPRLAERFKQEADKLALLDGHANICRIKHFFNHGDDIVIAMEYIDGVSLEDKIKEEGRIPIAESVKIVMDVLDILEFAHERGIYHRDIKPSNIMIDKRGQVKIIDFGIAKGKSDPSLTLAGTACGTPAYMAPEQFTPTEDTDYALVDVYATGTTLFHMLTGELPFMAENEFALRDAKIFNEPPKPRSINSGIPKDLETIILKSISKDPAQRYQSAKEFRHALKAVAADKTVKQTSTQEVPVTAAPTVPKTPPPRRKFSRMILGLAAVLTVVVAFAIYKFAIVTPEPASPTSPGAVVLLSPGDNQTFADNDRPTLRWQPTAGEGATYILQYATNADFTDAKTIAGIADGSFTFADGLDNDTYYWRIYPMSKDQVRGDPSPTWSFIVDVGPAPVPRGTFAVTVRPSGNIYVDGRLIGSNRSSASATLDTGMHTVRVVNDASQEKQREESFRIDAGRTVRREYTFTVPPPKPKEQTVEVRVGSNPRGATIYIDGELQAHKTNYTFFLKRGTHRIRATLMLGEDELEKSDTLSVVSDSTHKVFFDFLK